ncbi:MAG: class I fructose-bisphosphate aldolase [Dehalococcoidia bacterium]
MFLRKIAKKLVNKQKGILAADESNTTISKRFENLSIELSEENRRLWRNLLLTSAGIENYISGIILYDETIHQYSDNNQSFIKLLSSKNILSGIKVDKSLHKLAGSNKENITEGLDGLAKRVKNYKHIGLSFAKWRALIVITENLPTDYCISVNAHALARYAAICQEEGIVPIVEPEVFIEGSHSIYNSKEVNERVLKKVFIELEQQNVDLESIVLKPSMIIQGDKNNEKLSAEEIAEINVDFLMNNVPSMIPGIAFLSGGMSDEDSILHLRNINKLAKEKKIPWEITFSYGRGLQSAAMHEWQGKKENILSAQKIFIERCKQASMARQGL